MTQSSHKANCKEKPGKAKLTTMVTKEFGPEAILSISGWSISGSTKNLCRYLCFSPPLSRLEELFMIRVGRLEEKRVKEDDVGVVGGLL